MRQRIDDRNLKSEPPVVEQKRKHIALAEETPCAFRKAMQSREQCRRRLRRAERFHAGAVSGQEVERNVDPVEIAVIVLAVLQMIDDLQGGA